MAGAFPEVRSFGDERFEDAPVTPQDGLYMADNMQLVGIFPVVVCIAAGIIAELLVQTPPQLVSTLYAFSFSTLHRY